MKQSTVSVAMATYNGERFLQEQLDSLARQTLLPFELVACDDGSTDSTLDILKRFAAEAPFPVRIHQNEKRLGYGPNFLGAASLCSGDLIAFCDQDDVWFEYKLERCSAAISETGCVLMIHSAEVVDERLVPLGWRAPKIGHHLFLDPGAGRGWHSVAWPFRTPGYACVFRADLLGRIPPGPPLLGPKTGHEPWLLFAAEVTGGIALLPDVLVLYRQHGRNAIGSGPPAGLLQRFCSALDRSQSEYEAESQTAAGCASLLANAATRLPELESRLRRAQRWHEAREKCFALRSTLYAPGSSLLTAGGDLFSMVLGGKYRANIKGGLGLRGLVKDLFVLLLRRPIQRRLHNGRDHASPARGDCL